MNEQMITLMGGTELVVQKVDGSSETVKVLQLPIKLFPRLRGCLQDEGAQAELYCGKEKGWSDLLTPASHEEVITTGERINRDFFLRWVERLKARETYVPKADPSEIAMLIEAVGRANPALLDQVMRGDGRRPGEVVPRPGGLPNGLPRSAPSAG